MASKRTPLLGYSQSYAHNEFDLPGKSHEPDTPIEKPSRYALYSATTVASAVANRVMGNPSRQAKRNRHHISTYFILPATLKSEKSQAPNGVALPGGWAGVDSPSKREKIQATKNAQKRADSQTSGARLVGWLHRTQDSRPEKDSLANLPTLWHELLTFTTDKNHNLSTR